MPIFSRPHGRSASAWSILAAACLAALAPGDLRAQDTPPLRRVLVGVGGAFGAAPVASTIPIYGNDPACGVYGDATAIQYGPSATMRLPQLFSESLGLALRAGLLMQSSQHSGDPIDPQRAVDPVTGTLIDVDRELLLEPGLGALAVDLLASYSLGGLAIAAGPSVGFYVAQEAEARDVINAPSHATFRDGSREQVVEGGTTLTGESLAIAAVLDVSYAIPMSRRVLLSPRAEARIAFTSPYAEGSWSQFGIAAGIDLLFDITPAPRVDPPVVAVVDTPRASPTVITPTIDVALRSMDSTGAVLDGPAEVIYRDVVERRHLPLIPAVFFDSASTALPARARQYGAEVKPSDMSSVLEELSTLEAQTQLLNVVGERLRANRLLSVRLVGSTSGDEDRGLAAARAATVRTYLVDVWRVDPSQVAIDPDVRQIRLSSEATAEGRAENRRVEVIARETDVLRPVLVERRISQAVLPVRLALRMRSDVPAKWTARLSDATGELQRIDTTTQSALIVTVQPDEITPQSTSLSLAATAHFDRAEAQRRSVSIPLTWRRERTIIQGATERTADRERTTWQLLGFQFNSPDILARHREELRGMVSMISDSAHIVVTGYSDRLGEEKRNLELSRERAEGVAAALREELARRGNRSSTIEVVGAGVDETRFSNDLPEGRFLSRGVTVVAEQRARQ
jgi:outer membrane protein OmpA-like peptidoglycan-associated protein